MTALPHNTAPVPALSGCPACGSAEFTSFYRVDGSPTNANILFRTEAEAQSCPTGDIDLCLCPECGFVFNTRFDQALSEYSDRYEATQGFSPTFSGFQKNLAEGLINKHGLTGKSIVEIGSGHGEFLLLMSQLGNCRCTGIDPAADPSRIDGMDGAERVTLLPELYADNHAALPVDLLVCKMTLEHIPQAERFLHQIRRNLKDRPDAVVFFQVPESRRIFRDGAFEDVYYEHCSYFTPGSLARLFRRCGFSVLSLECQYADQYLVIEARADAREDQGPNPIEESVAALTAEISAFTDQVETVTARWRDRIDAVTAQSGKVALWGSGAKAVGFLSTVKRDAAIRHVVDINPHKADSYIPVSAQRIISPGALPDIDPDLVIIMNPVYEAEITRDLHALGLRPDIACL